MKKLLSALLALSMLLSVCAALAACGQNEEDGPGTARETSASTEVETTDPAFRDDLPALDYGGAELNLLSGDKPISIDELACVPTNGEIINDAVYERNLAVEDRLGVSLTVEVDGNGGDSYFIANRINKLNQSGDCTFQLVGVPTYVAAQYLVKNDYRDLYDCGNLNLSKAYWSQGYNEAVSFSGDHQFFATGSLALSLFRNMYVTLYNKDLLADQQLDDPYEDTLAGKWTLDYQREMITGRERDLNGDGVMDNKDFYAFVSGSSTSGDPYWVSCSAHVLVKNDEETFSYDPDIERLSSVMDKIMGVYYTTGSYIFSMLDETGGSNGITDAFTEGRAVMITTTIGKIELYLREFGGDYGILPMPKYDVSQPEYRTCVQDQVTGFCIPSTVQNDQLDMLGAVLEALAAESCRTVVPAYYNTALSYKYLNNQESVVMLDLTYDSVSFEIAQLFTSCIGGTDVNFLKIMRSILDSKENTVASRFQSIKKPMETGLKNFNKSLIKIIERNAR